MAQTHDVVIVGAGMVGLCAALALAQQGLKVAVLEQRDSLPEQPMAALKEAEQAGYDPRVSALTIASQQILTQLGAWEHIEQARACAYREMRVWDGQGSGSIHFNSDELHEPHLGHIVENRVIQAALLEQAQADARIELHTGVSLAGISPAEEGGRTLQLADGQILQTALVVGADGAHSQVRKLAALPMWEWDYGHHALVTTVRTAQPHQRTCWQRFTEDGPLAFLPLDDAHLCSIVWSTSPAHVKELKALDDADFCQALERAFEGRLGAVEFCQSRAVVPLRQRHATHYVEEGLAVIGDAAHTIHPLAGQGVNLGLLDAAALAEVLAQAARRGESLSDLRVLKRFERARQSDNIRMAAVMELFRRLFDEVPPVLQIARNLGMKLLDKAAPVKHHLVQEAMGLSGDLPPLAQRPIRH